jgi:hypothetical protein
VSNTSRVEARVTHVRIIWRLKTWPLFIVTNGFTYLKDSELSKLRKCMFKANQCKHMTLAILYFSHWRSILLIFSF